MGARASAMMASIAARWAPAWPSKAVPKPWCMPFSAALASATVITKAYCAPATSLRVAEMAALSTPRDASTREPQSLRLATTAAGFMSARSPGPTPIKPPGAVDGAPATAAADAAAEAAIAMRNGEGTWNLTEVPLP